MGKGVGWEGDHGVHEDIDQNWKWKLSAYSCVIKSHRVKFISYSNEDFNIYHASPAWLAASC